MALENAGYQEALSLYCNLEAPWMGIYDEGHRSESRRVWETGWITPILEGPKQDQGSTYHCTEDGEALLTPLSSLLSPLFVSLALIFLAV